MPPTEDQVIGDDAVAAGDRALVALADREDPHAAGEGRADHGADRGVHAGRVAAAGEHGDGAGRGRGRAGFRHQGSSLLDPK